MLPLLMLFLDTLGFIQLSLNLRQSVFQHFKSMAELQLNAKIKNAQSDWGGGGGVDMSTHTSSKWCG